MNSAFALFVLSLCAFVAVQASIEINVAHFAPAIEPRLADNAKSVDVWLWDADTFKAHAVFSPLFDSKSWQLLHENQVLADEDLATELRPFSTELGSTYQWARDAASPWLLKEFEWGHLSTTGNQEAAVEFVSPWRLMSQSPAENGAQLVDYYTCLVVLQQFIQSLVKENRLKSLRIHTPVSAVVQTLSSPVGTLLNLQKRQQGTQPNGSAPGNSSQPVLRDDQRFPRCWTTEQPCINATKSCSGHGQCAPRGNLPKEGGKCWQCACKPGWQGRACEYADYVPGFHILFWTTLILILTTIGVIVAMLGSDAGNSGAVAGRSAGGFAVGKF